MLQTFLAFSNILLSPSFYFQMSNKFFSVLIFSNGASVCIGADASFYFIYPM